MGKKTNQAKISLNSLKHDIWLENKKKSGELNQTTKQFDGKKLKGQRRNTKAAYKAKKNAMDEIDNK